jgi:uncharacterized protein YkwD
MGLAEVVARRQAAGEPAFEMSELVVLLRAQGSPHVWPRVWSLEAPELPASSIEEKWRTWLALYPGAGARRCGVARIRASHREIVVGVTAQALADLSPLPSQARLGQWLRLDARLVRPARGGRVVLLGPRGMPRDAVSRITGEAVHAVFSLDQPGLWQIQTLLDTETGPRPALEAWIFVDQAPDPGAALEPAPGETPGGDSGSGSDVVELRDALYQMVSAARRSEQLPSVRRDERLDALAQAHAEAMWRSGQTAHQTGWGSPSERVLGAGIRARRVGENVARARSLARAHRALWDSPSHRGNLLDPGFDALGLGVFVESAAGVGVTGRDPSGRARGEDLGPPGELTIRPQVVWVCELFVDDAGPQGSRTSERARGRAHVSERAAYAAEVRQGFREDVRGGGAFEHTPVRVGPLSDASAERSP